jgi:hypothetical protein
MDVINVRNVIHSVTLVCPPLIYLFICGCIQNLHSCIVKTIFDSLIPPNYCIFSTLEDGTVVKSIIVPLKG